MLTSMEERVRLERAAPASFICCKRRVEDEHAAECVQTRRAVDLVARRTAAAMGAVLLGEQPVSWLVAELRAEADAVEAMCRG